MSAMRPDVNGVCADSAAETVGPMLRGEHTHAGAHRDEDLTTDLHEERTLDLPSQSMSVTLPVDPPRNASPTEMPSAAPADAPCASPEAPASPPAVDVGSVLCGRYVLERAIGTGGTAVIWRARDLEAADDSADAHVALKIPRPDHGGLERMHARLQHEFHHARALSHPCIVRVFALERDGSIGFMTMELIAGKTLSFMLREQPPPPALAWRILRACGQALAYAHSQGIVHGDFKPANVFVTPAEGRSEDVKVVDFGAAGDDAGSPSRIPAATPAYASPEVLSGLAPEPRDDLYSFACVAYELLAGRHPFGQRSSLEARAANLTAPRPAQLSESQWHALRAGLSWQRAQRPASMAELLDGLTSPVPASPVTAPPLAHDPERELPLDLMPAQRGWGFAVFVLAAVGAVFLVTQRESPAPQQPAESSRPAAPPLTPPAATHNSALAAPPGSARDPDTERDTARGDARAPALTHASVPAPAESVRRSADTPAPAPAGASAAEGRALDANRPPRAAAPAVPLSEISFDSPSIVTSASALAAVFIVRRSGAVDSRAEVRWRTVGSAAGTSGIRAAGTVAFPAGQTQRAIYVPLDQTSLAGGELTFAIELHTPTQARLGAITRAEATILGNG